MALTSSKKLPLVDNFEKSQQEAKNKVVSSPFANMSMSKLEIQQNPEYRQPARENPTQAPQQRREIPFQSYNNPQPAVNQQQQRPVQPAPKPIQPAQRPVSQKPATVGHRVTKRTASGNTYSYADVYDHSNDIKPAVTKAVTIRIEEEDFIRLKTIAKRERISFNQLVVRAINRYR